MDKNNNENNTNKDRYNMNEYIEEIKDSNGMVSDTIHTGNFIIVPYYADTSY